MEDKLRQIEQQALMEIQQAKALDDLEGFRVQFLGRKGLLSNLIKEIANLPPQEKPIVGKLANQIKTRLADEVRSKVAQLSRKEQAPGPFVDVTLPGIKDELGHKHPITQTIDEVCSIFVRMGFTIAEGPEMETDYYNFQALNIPPDHPSRETFHTFFLDLPPHRAGKIASDWLLRSQTSTVQIRMMEKQRPPLRIVAPGKVFRPDALDASHSFMFHQIEGLLVDKFVTFSELKAALWLFAQGLFGEQIKMRFRPHFFPFTEPSAEVDISCIICQGPGSRGQGQGSRGQSQGLRPRSHKPPATRRCPVCKGKGWLEILGAGMVDPAVFEAVGYDPEEYSGFAFGMGVERIAMLKYGINDIRLFFENDLRFLKQF